MLKPTHIETTRREARQATADTNAATRELIEFVRQQRIEREKAGKPYPTSRYDRARCAGLASR